MRRRNRRERIPADTEEVPCGNAGADLGFDETAINTCNFRRKVGVINHIMQALMLVVLKLTVV